jgi:hypothetical protein
MKSVISAFKLIGVVAGAAAVNLKATQYIISYF